MSQIKVKAKYRDTVVGFNNSGKPLGQRDDLHLLLEIAKAGNVKYLLDMFEEIPDEQTIIEHKEQAFLNKRSRKRKLNKPPDKSE